MNELVFKINNNVKEGIETQVFPSHFALGVCGKPGSGKTTFIKQILKEERLLFKKFNQVFLLSPSCEEFKDLFLPSVNYTDKFEVEWIFEKIKMINERYDFSSYVNVLIIIDDFISSLKILEKDKRLVSLFYNRRHLLKYGMVSLIVTTQKYNMLPTTFRVTMNCIAIFNTARNEIEKIEKELITNDLDLHYLASRVISDDSFLLLNLKDSKYYKNFNIIYYFIFYWQDGLYQYTLLVYLTHLLQLRVYCSLVYAPFLYLIQTFQSLLHLNYVRREVG
jgi:hypothetical protein